MQLEPERPIEKLLRGQAAKRRSEGGDPPALHPVTRRVLQSEVRKQYPPQATAARTARFSIFKPAWGWALGAATAVLMLSFGVFFTGRSPQERPTTLAMDAKDRFQPANESAPASTSTVAAAPGEGRGGAFEESLRRAAVAVTNAPAVVAVADTPSVRLEPAASAETLREKKDDFLLATAPAVAAPTPTTGDALSYGVRSTGGLAGIAEADRLTLAEKPTLGAMLFTTNGNERDSLSAVGPASATVAPPLEIAAAPAVPLERAPSRLLAGRTAKPLTDSGLTAKTKGTESAPATVIQPVQAVLASFQVEQQGQSLRIIDSDGSIYTGALQIASADKETQVAEPLMRTRQVAVTESVAPAAAKAQPTPVAQRLDVNQNFVFRVSGTNRSLRQNVVFTGNLAGPPLPQGSQLANAVQLKFANNVPAQQVITVQDSSASNASFSNAAGYFAGKALQENRVQFQYSSQKQLQQLLQNSISGQAKLSDGRTVDVNALAVPANQK